MLLQPKTRLLCIGNDLNLLRTRCVVLASCGYEADLAVVTEVELGCARKHYDGIIVSAMMSKAELMRIAMATGNTPALVLRSFVRVPELLAEVEDVLIRATSRERRNPTDTAAQL